MQSIYAYKQCQQSNFHLATDIIAEMFAPDLNSMEPQDKTLLAEKRETAIGVFQENYHKKTIESKVDLSADIRNAASQAVQFYHQQNKKDLEHLRFTMLSEAEKVMDRYMALLSLLPALASHAKTEFDDKVRRAKYTDVPVFQSDLNFSNNRIIDLIRETPEIVQHTIRQDIDWDHDTDEVKNWYKEIVKKNEDFINYQQLANPGFEDDKKIVLQLVKSIIFKNESIQSFMEAKDISWAEDRGTLKSMVLKSLKALEEGGTKIELAPLSSNWEDDKEFFEDIFAHSIQNERRFEEMIAGKTQNWDIERVAAIDKIILIMALAEMLNFPSIPVKVTINEYIEISKNYSTPKSRQFVNGILDVLSTELTEDGTIKKSGRGLIDNK